MLKQKYLYEPESWHHPEIFGLVRIALKCLFLKLTLPWFIAAWYTSGATFLFILAVVFTATLISSTARYSEIVGAVMPEAPWLKWIWENETAILAFVLLTMGLVFSIDLLIVALCLGAL